MTAGIKFNVDVTVYENGKKDPRYALDSDLNGEITLTSLLEFTKSSLILVADQALKDEQSDGFDKNPITAVDGRVGKPVGAVHPLGKIEFVARSNMEGIILEAYEAIRDRSPVLTGRYVKSNYVFLNGTQVATTLEGVKSWLATKPNFKDRDLIRFVNIQPYARKLERLGVTVDRQRGRKVKSKDKRQRSGTHVAAPNGVYFLASKAIQRKYKRLHAIKFTFISGSSLGLTGSFKPKPGNKSRTYLYPTIIIGVSAGGIA